MTASLLYPFLPFRARVISAAFFALPSYHNEHELLRSCSLEAYLSDIVPREGALFCVVAVCYGT